MVKSRSRRGKAEIAEALKLSEQSLRGWIAKDDTVAWLMNSDRPGLVKFIVAAHSGFRGQVPRDSTLAVCNYLGIRYTKTGWASVNYGHQTVADLARALFGKGTDLQSERL